MKFNKNEFCKNLIIIFCFYKIARLIEYDILSLIYMFDSQAHHENIETAYVFSNYVNAVLMLLGIASCLCIIYYFAFCYGKRKTKNPLYIGCFLQASYLISTTVNFLVMYFVTDEFHAVKGNIYGTIQPFVSVLDSLVLCAIFILEGVTVLTNYKSVKTAKKACITLYIVYFAVRVVETLNMMMFTYTDHFASSGGIYSATDKEAVVHTLQMALGFDSTLNTILSLISFLVNFYVLLYMCFMDKNYEKKTSR